MALEVILQDKLGDVMNRDKDGYLTAFVREIGWYFNTFRLLMPRETIGSGALWNRRSTVFTNTHVMNRDKKSSSLSISITDPW